MITPALLSSWVPAGSSAPTASGHGSPARSAPPSTRAAPRAVRPSTPTTPASHGVGSSSSSLSGPSPACSRPMMGRPASGSSTPPPTPGRSAAGPGLAWRPSASCWSVRPPCWPSGCGRLAGPRRSRACSASPTRSARRSAPVGQRHPQPGHHRRLLRSRRRAHPRARHHRGGHPLTPTSGATTPPQARIPGARRSPGLRNVHLSSWPGVATRHRAVKGGLAECACGRRRPAGRLIRPKGRRRTPIDVVAAIREHQDCAR